MNKIRKSVWTKRFSLFMALNFLLFMFNPIPSYALSSGPGQPELEGFAPAGADNMVDLFTGDFSYNIPLLNVPGPDGGYPINLSYAAGIDMEQEASWVGLGWSLNAGAINREVRGLPDDFNGDVVTKELTQKPNKTVNVNVALKDVEAFGADLSKIKEKKEGDTLIQLSGNIKLIYNNYTGFSLRGGVGFSREIVEANRPSSTSSSLKTPFFTASYDPNEPDTSRIAIGYEYPFTDLMKRNENHSNRKSYFSSFVAENPSYFNSLRTKGLALGNSGFADASQVSDVSLEYPTKSKTSRFNGKVGLTYLGVTGDVQADVAVTTVEPKSNSIDVPAYGSMYQQQSYDTDGSSKGMMDFRLDNQSLLTPDSRILPVPIQTHDIFHIKAQGLAGTVRAHSGGMVRLSDPDRLVNNGGYGVDAELNTTGAELKVGAGGDGTSIKTYSGDWRSGAGSYEFLKNMFDDDAKEANPLLEPYYFAFKNEMTAEVNASTVMADENLNYLDLSEAFQGYAIAPVARGGMFGSPTTKGVLPSNSYKLERAKRVKNFQPILEKEANDYFGYTHKVYNRTTSLTESISRANNDQIGAITVTNENGSRYIYGIPAKNKVHRESIFSVHGSSINSINHIEKTVAYSSSDNSNSNNKGTDNFYSKTITPEHAHSWLLTEIVSPDYVDVNRDGPDPDDLGNYTAFEYDFMPDFASQTPASEANSLRANHVPGNYSNKGDDRGTISYYKKDLYFLKVIKTKTHAAVFETSERDDARGVVGEDNSQFSSRKMRKLDKITLYNLADYEAENFNEPIKTVNFTYAPDVANELCQNVPNNAVSGGGKLTLTEVWYSVGTERTKMSLSPYKFTYDVNPSYVPEYKDRWGCYQTNAQNKFSNNVLYPYASASRVDADTNAYSWNLTRIDLPTGGVIKVSYEADDYQYVQDKAAQNMYQILGFTNTSGSTTYNSDLSSGNRYMVVSIGKQVSLSQAKNYLSGINKIWYKSLIKYKDFENDDWKPDASSPFNNSDDAYDFVQGYLDYDHEINLFNPSEGLSDKVVIKIQKAEGVHPIRLAGLIDLKLNRTYLLDDSGVDLSGLADLGAKTLGTIKNLIGKMFNHASGDPFLTRGLVNGWCDKMSYSLPSIVRLNAVDDKIGGGHRVKKIEISDGWTDMGGNAATAQTYGQEYSYTLKDGGSSGVAQYEPMMGGEENPFRTPMNYSTDRLWYNDNYLHVQMPLAESIYPSPVVGYSRVVVKNLANKTVTIAGAGIQEHEFYTAKDYPLRAAHSDMEKVNNHSADKFITFIGGKDYFQPGFSQGFLIETNDMHGKQKASSTYAAHADLSSDAPRQKIEYFYKTKNGFQAGKANQLDNKVDVFYGDGFSEKANIGVEKDACINFSESQTFVLMGGGKANVSLVWPLVMPTVFANIDYSYGMTRKVAITKTIDRSAILEKVIATQDGAQTITENLGYDAEIGAPILTSVTNEYGDKIYDYSQPAHWHYTQAQGVYQNIGMEIIGDPNDYLIYLQNGDMLQKGNSIVWIKDLDTKDLVDENGNTVLWTSLNQSQAPYYKVVRSGYNNQQALQIGAIQSLSNPLNSPTSISFLNAYNAQKPFSMGTDWTSASAFNYTDCEFGATANNMAVYLAPVANGISSVSYGEAEEEELMARLASDSVYVVQYEPPTAATSACFGNANTDYLYLYFPVDSITRGNFQNFNLYYLGNGKVLADDGTNSVQGIVGGQVEPYKPNLMDCFGKCLEGVINASATTLLDTLKSTIDLDPTIEAAAIKNPYRFGLKGLLKTKEQLFYPQVRKQTDNNGYYHSTKINTDGEYDEFFAYKWVGGTDVNPNWKVATEVTQYDFNGNPVEEKDAIGNYSTVLFGYERTLPTAVAGNSKYSNIAFDSFEDHGASYQTTNSHHLSFSNVALDGNVSHTGQNSISVSSSPAEATLSIDAGKYVVFAWHYAGSGGTLSYTDGTTTTNAEVITNPIENWELLRLEFSTTGTGSDKLQLSGGNAHFDDIRLQPFNSSMKCFVYEPGTQKTIAVLDENHFATLYNYDRDQVLVQVKKETERGIKTIQSTQRATKVASAQ